jgi:hypothetical protein
MNEQRFLNLEYAVIFLLELESKNRGLSIREGAQIQDLIDELKADQKRRDDSYAKILAYDAKGNPIV